MVDQTATALGFGVSHWDGRPRGSVFEVLCRREVWKVLASGQLRWEVAGLFFGGTSFDLLKVAGLCLFLFWMLAWFFECVKLNVQNVKPTPNPAW